MCFSVQVDRDITRLSQRLKARVDAAAFDELSRAQAGDPKHFKGADDEGRIYPNYYAAVAVINQGERHLRPMRYRLRPAGSREEVPTKFNMFNARLDSLTTRPSWRPLLGKQHCLLPVQQFYEWVTEGGRKRQIAFRPEIAESERLWVPGLFDVWRSPDGKHKIESFAIITTEPPPEILQMGHDRCPVTLPEQDIDEWLDSTRHGVRDYLQLLRESPSQHYAHGWVS